MLLVMVVCGMNFFTDTSKYGQTHFDGGGCVRGWGSCTVL